MDEWQKKLVDDEPGIKRILLDNKVIAVVGMKSGAGEPAFTVPRYMSLNGYTILPVTPSHSTIMGRPCVPTLADLEAQPGIVQLFRRPEYCLDHAREVLAMPVRPNVVWMQSGIRNAKAAELLARAGIEVVQDRCMYVDHQSLLG